ncbi:MAG: TonB-dependent receptor [Gemmatimonadales bacterium]|nr:TonB-dependent receptor [Gemmatimonadales bacterium]
MLLLPAALAGQEPLRASLEVRDVPLVEALLRLRRESGAPIAWRGDQLPPRHRVTISRRDLPVIDVLTAVLAGTGLRVERSASGNFLVLPAVGSGDGSTMPAGVALASGIAELDQLIVTGSATGPAPGREQPTAVTAVDEADLRESPHRRLADQVRAFLPGAVSWDRGGAGPPPSLGGVRGVASFISRAPKVYIDGIEAASPELFTLLDGRAVTGLELVHGPQGAALYGPDALNGVMQVVTDHGNSASRQAVPRGALVAGGIDRADAGRESWGEAAAGMAGHAGGGSFSLLGSRTRLGGDPVSLADIWRAHAGGELVLGTIAVRASGWLAQHEAPLERLTPATGEFATRVVPEREERGAALTVRHRVSDNVTQSLTAGAHRIAGGREPFRSPILAPTLPLGATQERARRLTLRWAGTAVAGATELSVGAETGERDLRRSARQADGSVDLSALSDESLTTRGAFAQVRTRLGGLVISGGGRIDRVSSVGAEAESPSAFTAGAAWTLPVGLHTVRFRGAWGRATRPPEPGMSQAQSGGQLVQEANPALRSERQSGVELGAEWHAVGGGWLRATWFDQQAEELLQQVDLRRTVGTARVTQFQNVGEIGNRGVELDGGWQWGSLALAGRWHYVRSRIERLSPSYTGEFAVGDTPLEVPSSTGSAAIRYSRGGARVEVGATWIGPWTGFDWVLVSRVEQGIAADRDSPRDFWLDYAGVVRPMLGVTLPLAGGLSAWGRLEWTTRRTALLRDNLSPPVARSVLVGVELR